MQGMRGFMIVAATGLAMSACAPAAEHAALNTPVNSSTSITVRNQNWNDVVVYLLHGSSRVRLGTVNALSTSEFGIPGAYVLGVSDVTLQADPIGSSATFVSEPIQVYPGAHINLHIENAIRMSSYGVYDTGGPQ